MSKTYYFCSQSSNKEELLDHYRSVRDEIREFIRDRLPGNTRLTITPVVRLESPHNTRLLARTIFDHIFGSRESDTIQRKKTTGNSPRIGIPFSGPSYMDILHFSPRLPVQTTFARWFRIAVRVHLDGPVLD